MSEPKVIDHVVLSENPDYVWAWITDVKEDNGPGHKYNCFRILNWQTGYMVHEWRCSLNMSLKECWEWISESLKEHSSIDLDLEQVSVPYPVEPHILEQQKEDQVIQKRLAELIREERISGVLI